MASDLSTLIQEGFCSTLNGLLAKEATVNQTNKAVEQDFENKQHLMVESTFEFDNITSTWKFFIPAYTASLIFNTMLGDESEPVTEIDADIADAISEFISNLSGGLTTAINGAGFEDLGQSKFTIGNNEILDSLEDISDTYKFSIDLDGNNIEIYTKYDEIILPFLSVILSSPETVYSAEETPPEEEEEEQLVPVEESVQEEAPAPKDDSELAAKEAAFQDKEAPATTPESTTPKKDTKKDTAQEESLEDEEQGEPTEEDKKAKKLKLIIIAVGALLGVTIISGIVMYFMGAFDPEPVPVSDKNDTKMVKKVGDIEVIQYKSTKKTDFKPEMIDAARLNARLEALTKYEVLSDQEIAQQEAEQKERDYRLQKEQELMAFAAKNKEENIFIEEKNTSSKIEENNSGISKLDKIEMVEEKSIVSTPKDDKLKFVLVESLKYKLYKNLISQVNTHQARISICKNSDGRTSVYIGPFNDGVMQSKMLELLESKNVIDAKKINLNKEEFDSRCNFE